MPFWAFLSVWGCVFAARVIGTAIEFAVLALTWSQCSSALRAIAVGDGNVTLEFVMADVGNVLLLGCLVFSVVCEQDVIYALYLAFGEDSGLELIDYSGNLIPVYYRSVSIDAEACLS